MSFLADLRSQLLRDCSLSETKKYVLKSWPDGYQMYDHNKGPEGNPRHDLYLVGKGFLPLIRVLPYTERRLDRV